MNLADVFTIVFIILGFIIVYISYWLLSVGLFPRFVERCATQIGAAPVKTTVLGAVLLVPLVAIGLGISSKAPNGAVKLFGLSIALLGILGGLFGSAGLALRIGQGLKSARDDHEPWRRVLRGGIVLALTFVMPFLGTFVIMPFTFICGFGAFAICVFRRKSTIAAEPVPAAVEEVPPLPVAP
jgi:hypothetical protein